MISFVYFDVGGVAIKDFSETDQWDKMKESLGITQEKRLLFDTFWKEIEERICVDLDIDTKVKEMNERVGLQLPDNFSWLKEFVKRFRPNESLWPIMNRMKQKKRVGLLTNMYVNMLDEINAHALLPPIEWDVVIDSSVVKLQKPDPGIFTMAEKQTGVKAQEILFIDNSDQNITAAKKHGWQTFWYDSRNYDQASKDLQAFIRDKLT